MVGVGGFRGLRPTAAVAWLATVVGGGLVVAGSVAGFVTDPPSAAFGVLLLAAVYFAARPMVVLRQPARVFVEVGSAFSLSALYVWGLPAAVVLTAVSWILGDAVRRTRPLTFAFHVGNVVLSITAAWWVMAAAGYPDGLGESLRWNDIWWLPLTWAAHFAVNLGLLAFVVGSRAEHRWAAFRADLPWHVVSESVGFTLSPVLVTLVAEGPLTSLLLTLPLALISETYAVTRRAEHEAMHDALTELANRRRFMLAIEERVALGGAFVLLLVDLDRFKRVNDAHGHQAGDALLVEVGRRLAAAVRGDDLVARLGGDEFAVLLGERATRAEAQEVARRLHSSLIRPVRAGDQFLSVGASVGAVVVTRSEPLDVDETLRRADRAMYAAKQAGTGIRIWSPALEGPPGAGPERGGGRA